MRNKYFNANRRIAALILVVFLVITIATTSLTNGLIFAGTLTLMALVMSWINRKVSWQDLRRDATMLGLPVQQLVNIVADWDKTCRACGLAVIPADSWALPWYPRLYVYRVKPYGLYLEVFPVPGVQTTSDLTKTADRLATHWGCTVTAGVLNSTVPTVWFKIRVRSPYPDQRPAMMKTTSTGLQMVIGRDEDGKDLYIDLGKPEHMLIQGQTRSGKSATTEIILGSLANRSDVLLTGIDPTNLLLGPADGLPHPELRHTGTADMAQAMGVLKAVETLMDERNRWLRDNHYGELTRFSADMPLCVLVLEEFNGVVVAFGSSDTATGARAGDRLEPAAKRTIQRIVQEGAKAGIRVILLTQRAEASIVGGDVRSNFAKRITMRVDNPDSVRLLHPNATAEDCAEITRFDPGYGVIQQTGKPDLTRFRLDYCDNNTYLKAIEEATNTAATI
jgi:S-DNA-T family DNA segregation ATPase FtsK/SpoIIIE